MNFGDQNVLFRSFNSIILPWLGLCFPVWSYTADCHLKVFDHLQACKLLIPNIYD